MATKAVTYVGRSIDHRGKTLWEIVGCLKDYGVGRIVIRNMYQRDYPEPSYMKILKVEALPEPPAEVSTIIQRVIEIKTEKF